MIPEKAEHPAPPAPDELSEALAAILARHRIPGLPIVALERRPSAYRSTFPLEEIRVVLSDGTALDVIFKDLSRPSLSDALRQAKPDFLADPMREIETYQLLAPDQPELGTARCFGAVTDAASERYWLFLEKVPGEELSKIGEFSTWESTARWLAGMHQKFAASVANPASRSRHWLSYNSKFYQTWMRRARELSAQASTSRPTAAGRDIARIARHYERVVDRLTTLPNTLIHGEFYASNVLIVRSEVRGGRAVGVEVLDSDRSPAGATFAEKTRPETGLRICPIDWEMAAVGPGLVDLAALVSGRWTEGQRTAMALAYFDSLGAENRIAPRELETFLAALDDCRLHVAVQWLGWSNHWSPPPEHAQDWLAEALHLAEKTGCLP